MDFRQLQYYREIVKQGNISKAARVLNIAQPPLSQLLKKMEIELDTTLIHRYRQKWELTESGKLLYQYAEQMLNQMEEVKQQITEIEAGTSGTIHIGVSSACANILIDYIVEFRSQFEQIKLTIFTGDSETLLKKLKRKELDIALLIKPSNTEGFKVKSLKTESPVLVVPIQWAKELSEAPTIKEIASFPFIMLGAMEGHSLYGKIIAAFEEQEAKPNVVVEAKNISLVVELVNRGLGISIIPKMHYKSSSYEQLQIYDFQQFDFRFEPVMMTLKDAPISKATTQFWNMASSFEKE